jgi:hypothetical protein
VISTYACMLARADVCHSCAGGHRAVWPHTQQPLPRVCMDINTVVQVPPRHKPPHRQGGSVTQLLPPVALSPSASSPSSPQAGSSRAGAGTTQLRPAKAANQPRPVLRELPATPALSVSGALVSAEDEDGTPGRWSPGVCSRPPPRHWLESQWLVSRATTAELSTR